MDYTVYEACSDRIIDSDNRVVSADEVLAQKVGELVPIPFKTREDLEIASAQDRKDGLFEGELVPRMDLRVLHYFGTQLVLQKYPHLVGAFDETSLIALGLVVEKWVKDSIVSKDEVDRKRGDDEETGNLGIGVGPSQVICKKVDYRHSPSNI
ncbi:hypothetical protein HG535_0E03110 [Zygotorulaspora mrakii]|uniref:Uncharacterized protein n=1 Tax=Zygotorulaspora mrakii TaxID=42260 RepID=A0A7H9B3Z5_ZYGMR|nr:uncharacterized protein HG535_0E03110 [Zygotorulaspora mrakii]QLG73227.1 hypothetical protein HG535_0E03110 [Zygotorulaspora mrakii]